VVAEAVAHVKVAEVAEAPLAAAELVEELQMDQMDQLILEEPAEAVVLTWLLDMLVETVELE
tara:strand:- start:140 stop:325 length:186 start_codon:yes stop_codon:yes gene_type:complete